MTAPHADAAPDGVRGPADTDRTIPTGPRLGGRGRRGSSR